MKKYMKVKRYISSLLVCIMVITMMLPNLPVIAAEAEKYPFTMFAASSKEGAITVDAANFNVNGNIGTNGTIISTGNMNINGIEHENAGVNMIYILEKLNTSYFSNSNVEGYPNDYSNKGINIDIDNPIDVQGVLELTGNISLNSAAKAHKDVNLNGDALNTYNAVICSETGDILIHSTNVNLNGLIYAPNGNIYIEAQYLNMNDVIVVAQTITIIASTVNANYSNSFGKYIGNETENDPEPDPELGIELYAFGEYITNDNSINILWKSTVAKGIFDIQISDDNDSYTSIATVTDDSSYNYNVTESFEKRYFKVTETTYNGETASAIPFVAVKTDTGYEIILLDTDEDGIPDVIEEIYGTDINNPDSDNDDLTDYQEVYVTGTDPLVYNSYNEALSDADADCDIDGISNIDEIITGTNPLEPDTDGDGINDKEEPNYNTDSLNPDTDEDLISDGDEIRIGLDPTNPTTFGIPDAEYKATQTITAESEALSKINTSESPYKLSMNITAAGYVEGNIVAKETSYSKVVTNDSMIGIAPELKYEKSDSIDSVTLRFEVSDEYIDNTLNLFPDEEELIGIKRLNIFKYFEEINMLLPIETQFDLDNNIIYTEVDELGTYCIMDMEIWLNGFDVPEEIYKTASTSRTNLSVSYSSEFTEEETRMIASEMLEYSENIKADIYENNSPNINTTMVMDRLSASTTIHTPIDIVFILQTAGTSEKNYNLQKQLIKEVTDDLYDAYSDIKVCLIEYKENEASIVSSFTYPVWQEHSASMTTVLDKLEYESTVEYCNRGAAFSKMLNDITFRDNAGKFVFQMMNGATTVGSGYFSQLDACEDREINYSEISPSGWHYIDSRYEEMVIEAISRTNGLNLTYDSNTTETVYNHIVSHVAPPQVVFNAIVPSGWKQITLNDILDPNNDVDTDEDTLTDWKEVDTSKIQWDANGSVILPTIFECIRYANKTYSVDGLERFKSDQWGSGMPTSDFEKYLQYLLDNVHILPINSDPTEEDTDGDGLLDGTAIYVGDKKVAPKDTDPLMVNGLDGIWKEQIYQERYGVISTEYDSDAPGLGLTLDKALADFLVSTALMFRSTINDNEEKLRAKILDIKERFEGDTEIGAYILNFIYDEDGIAYHSLPDTWQRNFGYNDLYDDAFRIGSNMHYGKVRFTTTDGEKYALWLWKGDYWNMQSGAEIGLYIYKEDMSGTEHYDVVDFELPMTLSLYNYYSKNNIKNLFNWAPTVKQWWVTGFNPDFTEPDPNDMVIIGTIDFAGREKMFDAMKSDMSEKHENINKENIIFDEDGHTIWIVWYL